MDIEDIVQQPDQPVGVVGRHFEHVPGLFGKVAEKPGGNQPQSAPNRSQRSPQFMADHGNKLILHFFHFFALRDVQHGGPDQKTFLGFKNSQPNLYRKLATVFPPRIEFQPGSHRTRFRMRNKRLLAPGIRLPEPLRRQYFNPFA